MYTNPKVAQYVEESFIPVRVHVKDNAADFQRLGERFGAQWTPTILILDKGAQERHRIEGFLPVEDFLPQLVIGRGHAAFGMGDYGAAARLFDEVLAAYPESDVAPEAQYWAGVARYKGTGDASALHETARKFTERFQDTSWAKKASVWR